MAIITNGATDSAVRERRDIDLVLASIEPLPPERAWPALLVLVGPPGSGKSTVARALRERMPLAVLDIDAIRALFIEHPDYSFEETRRAMRAARLAAAELLERRRTVVIDAPNLTEWERQPLYSLAALHRARLIVVQVTAPMNLVQERIRRLIRSPEQAAGIDMDDHQRMAGRQEPITRPHLTVDTSRDIRPFVEGLVLDLEEG